MTSNRFFIKQSDIDSSSVYIHGDEHHHLSRVARIRPKEKVWLIDEQGTRYMARVEEITKMRTRLTVLEKEGTTEPGVKIILAQAVIKSKRMNSILQQATELGVSMIIPVITARTVVNIEAKVEKKLERWEKLVREAAKQCKCPFFPSILPPMPLKSLIEERQETLKLVLSENRGKYLRDILIRSLGSDRAKEKPPASVIILVGPEGGWTDEEEESILSHGYEAVSLGKQILRSETAALSGLAMISHFWNQ
ncbi:MAG: RsmE family RNA methyltransferase [Candidatus Aminicenantes bacterium]